jgi:hypothetical protein
METVVEVGIGEQVAGSEVTLCEEGPTKAYFYK